MTTIRQIEQENDTAMVCDVLINNLNDLLYIHCSYTRIWHKGRDAANQVNPNDFTTTLLIQQFNFSDFR